jgi:hypothetical protein
MLMLIVIRCRDCCCLILIVGCRRSVIQKVNGCAYKSNSGSLGASMAKPRVTFTNWYFTHCWLGIFGWGVDGLRGFRPLSVAIRPDMSSLFATGCGESGACAPRNAEAGRSAIAAPRPADLLILHPPEV